MLNLKSRIVAAVLLFSFTASVAAGSDDLNDLALQYFHAKIATQQPDATAEDLEAYLALLTDDIGYEQKPYRLLDAANPNAEDGKQRMREGMTYYLGGNEEFTAELENVAFGFNAIAIQYSGIHKFRRGGEGPIVTKHYSAMEVLEIVDGKVSIIREYKE